MHRFSPERLVSHLSLMPWPTYAVATLVIAGISLAIAHAWQLEQRSLLERIQDRQALTVVTRFGSSTYFEGVNGPTGQEYDLAAGFAKYLGVDLKIHLVNNGDEAISAVTENRADVAAAALLATPQRAQTVRFGPSYDEALPTLVDRMGEPRLKDLTQLGDRQIEVVAGSAFKTKLEDLSQQITGLKWQAHSLEGTEELLERVADRSLDLMLAGSNDLMLARRFFPNLRVAMTLKPAIPIAWAFANNGDSSLAEAAEDYFQKLRETGELSQIHDRHYGHVSSFDFVDSKVFLQHIENRLPKYRSLFEAAAAEAELDWRLLAAIGYQESHWDPRAVSPTGVRGIMMLTLSTADLLDLDNRLDPEQSIFGGAQYFAKLVSKLPARIQDPDRTWMGLAAYNVGFGHLEDARVISEIRGTDPDKWIDVRASLPLLTRREWFAKVKHGYARGYEPVHYVRNVRKYYDTLVWYSQQSNSLSANHTNQRPVKVKTVTF